MQPLYPHMKEEGRWEENNTILRVVVKGESVWHEEETWRKPPSSLPLRKFELPLLHVKGVRFIRCHRSPLFFGTGDAPFFLLPMFPLLPAQSSLRSVGAGASRGSLLLQKCQPWRAGEQLGRGGGGTDGGWRTNGRSFSLLLSVVGPRWAVAAAEGEVGGAPKEGEADAR